jgi:hypothetical protein
LIVLNIKQAGEVSDDIVQSQQDEDDLDDDSEEDFIIGTKGKKKIARKD